MNPKSPVFPRKVYVRFRGRMCDVVSPSFAYNQYYVAEVALSATPYVNAYSGTYTGMVGEKTFHDTAVAVFTAGSPTVPTNKATLDALALRIAKDYYESLNRQIDVTYAGICNIEPNARLEEIVIDYCEDYVTTRIHSPAIFGSEPEQLSHWDTAAASCTNKNTPFEEFYGPPGDCVGGHVRLTVWRVSVVNGRLVKRYARQDTL